MNQLAQARTNYAAAIDVADADGFHAHGIIDTTCDVIRCVDCRPHEAQPATEFVNAAMLEFIAGRRHNRQTLAPRQRTILDLLTAGF